MLIGEFEMTAEKKEDVYAAVFLLFFFIFIICAFGYCAKQTTLRDCIKEIKNVQECNQL